MGQLAVRHEDRPTVLNVQVLILNGIILRQRNISRLANWGSHYHGGKNSEHSMFECKSFKQQTLQLYTLRDHLSIAGLNTSMCQICFFPKTLLNIDIT